MGSGEMFNSIAPKYDIINKFMSLGLDQSWRRQLVESIELKPTDRVLDLATGTADVAILIGKALSEKQGSGKVIGIDPSANMIGIGDDKVGNEGLAEVVTLQLGDAQDLNEIPSHSFDKVTMSFGIRNVPDREAALKEIYRVLVKSSESRVSIMEFHQPSAGVLALVARFFIKSVTPLIGWFMSGNFAEYDHLEKSIFAFPSVEEWSRLMESCGFEMIESKNACMDTVYIHTAKPKSG
eukprot:CAMPEP_0117754232 /NCGR_PEP_ID=MMETSP0947-20121206/12709_1 /TAXON_ID=44440 /ORGANISM="Chattonella subsalsa, Strain CCMP2191" /LENGTH=237 /DNA_ID=CAMNT_0005573287 /DNA_START=107 /DNA_END=820 /DNA_ORIENTATION=+